MRKDDSSIRVGVAYFSLVLLATFPSFLVLLVAFLFLEKLLQLLVLVPKTSEPHAGSSCSAGTFQGISPTVDKGPVGVDIGLLAFEQALVHSGLNIDLLTYEQVLVQDGQERGHHF